MKVDFEKRFWEKVDKTDYCWIWEADIRNGYGLSQDRNKTVRSAHRIAYEEIVGDIPEGLELDHLCHTWDKECMGGHGCLHRRCVNPEHLQPVTHLENGRRGRAGIVSAKRQRSKTHCKWGHPFDDGNTWIEKDGSRHCRECDANRHRLRYKIKEDIRNEQT